MKKKILIISLLGMGILVGAFFRFSNLENTVIWDGDASLYSIYARKYYEIIKLVKSDQLRSLWKAKKEGVHYVSLETFAQNLRQDPKYNKLIGGIEATTRAFPDWVNKPQSLPDAG